MAMCCWPNASAKLRECSSENVGSTRPSAHFKAGKEGFQLLSQTQEARVEAPPHELARLGASRQRKRAA